MDIKKNNSFTDVFISFKYHAEDGSVLPDYQMAKELFEKLSNLGLNTFFSDESITQMGVSDYKRLIDDKLDEAKLLIVVSTTPDNCQANWVRYEWDTFYQDILSGRKDGELISYLDSNDISSFPRTIRTRQVYEKRSNGISNLLTFVKAYFEITQTEDTTQEFTSMQGSSYNYDGVYEALGDERSRLALQAKVESKHDSDYLSSIMQDKNETYNVLDVGCSVGALTFDVFSDYTNSRVLGVDKFQSCVDEFNNNRPSNHFKAKCINFENADWDKQLRIFMDEQGVASFDLVYCSLSLHHMSDSLSVIKKLWSFISDKGFIYIRTCDDSLKIAYPNGEIIYDVIKKTATLPNVSDRFHGRKMYSYLYKAKFINIRIESFLIDTGNKDIDERYALFYSAFAWRKNYFKNRLANAKNENEMQKAMHDYNSIMHQLDEIEELFTTPSFYFGYYTTIAIGQKKDLLSNENQY